MPKTRDLIVEVLEKGYLMSLATIDESGPWLAAVRFSFDDQLSVYWASQESVRHSQALALDPRAAVSVTLCNKVGDQKIGIQIQGRASVVDQIPLEAAVRYNAKKGKPAPTSGAELLQPGQSWYCLTPTKIDLIYEPLFGYEKKFLEL